MAALCSHNPVEIRTGRLDATGLRAAIVVARFNDLVAGRLVEAAIDTLVRHGAADDDISVTWVPGSFEIPFAAQEVAAAGGVDMVLCLGVVIRGETPHFDLVAGEASAGVLRVGMETRIPTLFGVVTTETLEQALDRAGGKHGNKGADVALAGIEMARLTRTIRDGAANERAPRLVDR